jgi:type IV pilus assembly protein PilP
MTRITLLIPAVALLAATPLNAQAPAPGAAAPAAATTPGTQVPALEPQGYDYNPAGRRDPFISLVQRTTQATGTSATSRPTGLGGLSIEQIRMTGVVKGRQGFSAIVKGADNRMYSVKAGDELYDGKVRAVTADAMFLIQSVNDPLSVAKTREIKRLLRPEQEAQ